jgi:hypothetical protein
MPEFVAPQFRQPNIPIRTPPQKVRLTKNEVSLQFLMARDIGKTYRITYLLNIIPNRLERNPSIPLSPANVDMAALKNAIMNNVKAHDKMYMTLVNYDTRKAIFDFEHEKWLRDSVTDSGTTTKVTRFAREFRMKRPVPSMIMFDPMRTYFAPFILRKFKEFMDKGNKGAKWFKHLLPDAARSRMRSNIRNMFDWEYNFQWNMVTAALKPLYIMAIIYAVGALTRQLRKEHLKSVNTQKMFATRVYSNLKQFDYGKFDKYSKRKGFV